MGIGGGDRRDSQDRWVPNLNFNKVVKTKRGGIPERETSLCCRNAKSCWVLFLLPFLWLPIVNNTCLIINDTLLCVPLYHHWMLLLCCIAIKVSLVYMLSPQRTMMFFPCILNRTHAETKLLPFPRTCSLFNYPFYNLSVTQTQGPGFIFSTSFPSPTSILFFFPVLPNTPVMKAQYMCLS